MIELPQDLLSAIIEGRCVLFLGAGASRGASDGRDKEVPDADGLATILTDKFLGDDYANLDLRSAYDLSCSVRDVRTVQRSVFDTLDPIQPAPFHLLVPKFPWAGLATTNYDLVIERAYAKSGKDTLVPFVKDGDHATDRLTIGSQLYVKLHGCITRHQEVHPPLIASTEQLISHREGRNGQFDTFLEWAKTKTVVFCGYSFLDPNLRALFNEVIKEGDNRPRHYIVNKGAREAEINYWADRRVTAFDATFQNFLEEVDRRATSTAIALGSLMAREPKATSFSKFITTTGACESAALKTYLSSLIEHVSDTLEPPPREPKQFYSGFDLGWYPYAVGLDVIQQVTRDLKQKIITGDNFMPSHPLRILKGHAGSGKTVALRRACFDAATKHGRLCFFVGRQHSIQVERFEEIISLTNVPILLFVDDVAHHKRQVQDLCRLISKTGAKFNIIAAEDLHVWNIACDELEVLVSGEHETRYLGETGIRLLLEKLEEHDCLGYLKPLSDEERLHELKHVHGRQLLVALLEATHGTPLVEIIEREYRSIEPPEARLIYLDICSLHRFGPPVRAGLISRIHDVSFDQFAKRFFKPLERIVASRMDPKSGDYVYEARHSFIASALYETVLKDQDERFENLIRIIKKLNPAFSYDQEVMRRLIRADGLRQTLNDHAKIRQVYDEAEGSFGSTAAIYHQRGIFEMHVASNLGGLAVAEREILKAAKIEEGNRSIRHSLAELDLKRSRVAEDPIERIAWRRSAVAKAKALVSQSANPYPHHTIVKAAVDGVRDALEAFEKEDLDETTISLADAIAEAESTLRNARRSFPNEAVLLTEEAHLAEVLSQADKAELAFEKAFSANERSTLTAKRLARIQRSKGHFDKAAETLRKCLTFNPSSQDLRYSLAMTIMESRPDADQIESETLLYHLRRSFAPNDRNLQAQFWYARQLCLADRYDEARPIFRNLKESRAPFGEKTRARGELYGPDGELRELIGTVDFWQESWGFLSIEAPFRLRIYFRLPPEENELADYISVGSTARFNLAFSLMGPLAFNLAL